MQDWCQAIADYRAGLRDKEKNAFALALSDQHEEAVHILKGSDYQELAVVVVDHSGRYRSL